MASPAESHGKKPSSLTVFCNFVAAEWCKYIAGKHHAPAEPAETCRRCFRRWLYEAAMAEPSRN